MNNNSLQKAPAIKAIISWVKPWHLKLLIYYTQDALPPAPEVLLLCGNEKSSSSVLSFSCFLSLLSSLLVCIPVAAACLGWEWRRRTESLVFWLQPLTPCALESGLLSWCDLISIFIVYQPWGSILAWMLFTNERNHW